MKIIKTILFCGLCLCMTVSLYAQSENKNKTKPIASWEKNWYIEAGGGFQFLLSKNANQLLFKDRITSAFSLTGGRWISPFWGVRLQAQGYAMNGFAMADGTNWNDPVRNHVNVLPSGNYPYYLRFLDLHADAQVSLANLILGYDHNRKWDVIPAIGIGYIHAFPFKGTSAGNSCSGHLSVMAKYRLPKGFDINLEVQGAIIPDRFDGRKTGSPDGLFGVTASVSYHFGKIHLKKRNKIKKASVAQVVWDEERLRQIISEELKKTSAVKAEKDTVYVIKETETKTAVSQSPVPFLLTSIRFEIGKSTPQNGQDILFQNIADYLQAFPNAKIRIEGYADEGTGSVRQNLHLSMQRAVEVHDILKYKYGIDEKRMTDVQGVGSDYQPYKKNEWNRIVLIKVIE